MQTFYVSDGREYKNRSPKRNYKFARKLSSVALASRTKVPDKLVGAFRICARIVALAIP
jgi:hypothetical protein